MPGMNSIFWKLFGLQNRAKGGSDPHLHAAPFMHGHPWLWTDAPVFSWPHLSAPREMSKGTIKGAIGSTAQVQLAANGKGSAWAERPIKCSEIGLSPLAYAAALHACSHPLFRSVLTAVGAPALAAHVVAVARHLRAGRRAGYNIQHGTAFEGTPSLYSLLNLKLEWSSGTGQAWDNRRCGNEKNTHFLSMAFNIIALSIKIKDQAWAIFCPWLLTSLPSQSKPKVKHGPDMAQQGMQR
eukprot:1156805-Pelagomonas_calceolata.AAC.2